MRAVRTDVSVASGIIVGPAKQFAWFASASAEAVAPNVRLAPPPPHLRHQLPAAGRRHRAALDGARAHADHHDATLPAPVDEDLSASHQKVSILNRLGLSIAKTRPS